MGNAADGMWAIKYNGQNTWIHKETVRRTRTEAIDAIGALTYPEMSWRKLKKFLNIDAIRVKVTEV